MLSAGGALMLIVIGTSAIVLRASAARPAAVRPHLSSQSPTPGATSVSPFDVTPSATAGGIGGGGGSATTSASPAATGSADLPVGWVPHANYAVVTYDRANGYPLMLTLEAPPQPPETVGVSSHAVTATWKWDGSRWVLLHPADSPPNLNCQCLAWSNLIYDPLLHRVVVVASVGTTWAWDGANWTDLNIIPSPAANPGHTSRDYLSFDPARHELVLLQTTFYEGTQTWTSDGKTWSHRHPTMDPSGPPLSGGVAYDPLSARVLIFGGEDGMGANNLNETWSWDGATWTKRQPPRRPAGGEATLAYNETTQQMVLFEAALGGPAGTRATSTWSWNGSSWSQISAGGGPAFGDMTYDPSRHELILVGGSGEMYGAVQTWTSSGATGSWTIK